MTREGWRLFVLRAVEQHCCGDDHSLDLLSRMLEEVDRAKQALRDKGYGCTGMGWLETVAEVPNGSAPQAKPQMLISEQLARMVGVARDDWDGLARKTQAMGRKGPPDV